MYWGHNYYFDTPLQWELDIGGRFIYHSNNLNSDLISYVTLVLCRAWLAYSVLSDILAQD